MTNHNASTYSEYSEIVPFSSNTVDLSETATEWATDMARTVEGEEAQWHAFLRSLAVAGFEQWLAEGSSIFTTHRPVDVPALNACTNFQANNYQLNILTAPGSAAETVEIALCPANATASTISNRLAHFYVLVEVQEEIDRICILAGLQRTQLLQQVSQQTLEESTSIEISQSLFDIEPEQILLYISCLEPEAALSPVPQAKPVEVSSTGFVNAGRWLQGQLDELATQLAWVLLPPPGTASALRPGKDPIKAVTAALAAKGIRLPAIARGISGPVTVERFVGELYAWAWPVETEGVPEWTLLLLLGAQAEEVLPQGIQIQVSDDEGTIAQETLEQSAATCLYTQVQGTHSERFRVRIVLPNGREKTLPAFYFQSSES